MRECVRACECVCVCVCVCVCAYVRACASERMCLFANMYTKGSFGLSEIQGSKRLLDQNHSKDHPVCCKAIQISLKCLCERVRVRVCINVCMRGRAPTIQPLVFNTV